MMKFMNTLRGYRSPQVIEANCNAPTEMIGKHLNDVQPDEFHCCKSIFDIALEKY